MSADRYSTVTREVPVDHPRNTAYPDVAPATGELSSQHRVSLHPAGFRVRERGALEGTVVHAYRCPVHGLVDVRVPRAEVPDKVACPAVDHREERPAHTDGTRVYLCTPLPASEWDSYPEENNDPDHKALYRRCHLTATWAGSQCGQGWAAGECKS